MTDIGASATGRLDLDVSKLKSGVRDANASLASLYSVIRDNWWGIKNIGTAFAGVGAAIAGGVGEAVKQAANFEQGMAGVARTTAVAGESADQAAAATSKLAEQLRAIARTRPVDLSTITNIAEQAGALGVARKDIAQFTGTIADLVATTNLTADSATKLARVAGVFHLTAGQYKNLGSSIFETGRSTAATESEILNMTTRLSGAGAAAGLTADQVVGLSAATLSLGSRAEAGASALQRTLRDIQAAAAGGGVELKNFATVAGMTQSQFRKLAAVDPGKALTAFIEGLGKFSGNGVLATSVMNKLGITEVRQVQALAQLAAGSRDAGNAQTDLSTILNISNESFRKGTAITDAAAKQYQTLTNQVHITINNARDLAITYGGLLLPAIKAINSVLQDFIAGMALLHGVGQEIASGFAIAAGALAIFAGGVLLIGPRIALAVEAYARLRTALGEATAAALINGNALRVAADGSVSASLREAFAAGFAAKANAAKAAADARAAVITKAKAAADIAATAATEARTEAELAATEAMVLNAQVQARLAAANSAFIAGEYENAKALFAEAAAYQESAVAAAAKAAASEAAAVSSGEVAAAAAAEAIALEAAAAAEGAATVGAFTFGAALRFMLGPVGLLITAVGALVAVVTYLGHAHKEAASAAERFKVADEELVGAIRQEIAGHRGAVTAVLAHRLAMSGAIGTAQRLGISMVDLMNVIRGTASAEVNAAFVRTLSSAMAQGDQDAKALAQQVYDLNQQLYYSSQAFQDETAAAGGATGATKDATRAANSMADASQKQADGIQEANRAMEDLPSALLGEEEAALSVKDAEEQLAQARAKSAQHAEDVKKAENDLAQAEIAQVKARQAAADAEAALASARASQQRELADAVGQLADDEASYEDAIANVGNTQEKLNALLTPATPLQLVEAYNKLRDAELKMQDAQQTVADAQANLNYLLQEGASARDIADAQRQLAAAHAAAADATTAVADAQGDLNTLQNGGDPAAIAKAERDLAKARREVHDASQKVADDEAKIARLRRDIKNDTAYKAAQQALREAQLELASADFRVLDATRALHDAQKDTSATNELTHAQLALKEALVRQAQAIVQVRKDQALARGETYDSAREARDFAAALNQVADTVGGPLGAQLHAYAGMIHAIPEKKQTDVSVDIPGGGANADPKLNRYLAKNNQALAQFENANKKPSRWRSMWNAITSFFTGDNVFHHFFVIDLQKWAHQGVNAAGHYIAQFFTRTVPQFFTGLGRSIAQRSVSIWRAIESPFITAGSYIATFITRTVPQFFGRLPGLIGSGLSQLPDVFAGILVRVASGLGYLTGRIISAVVDAFYALATETPRAIAALAVFLVDVAKGAWESFGTAVSEAWNLASTIATWVADKGPEAAVRFGRWVATLPSKAWDSFVQSLAQSWTLGIAFGGWLKNAGENAKDRLWDWMHKLPGRVWGGFTAGISATWTFGNEINDWINRTMSNVGGMLTSFGSKIAHGIWNGIKTAWRGIVAVGGAFFTGLFDGLNRRTKDMIDTVFIGPINQVIDFLNNLDIKIPKIHVPGVGDIGGQHIGFPDIPRIPRLREGGIATRATLGVFGEAGSEALVPLDQFFEALRPLATMAAQLDTVTSLLRTIAEQDARRTLGAVLPTGAAVAPVTNNYNDYSQYSLSTQSPASAEDIAGEIQWTRRGRRR